MSNLTIKSVTIQYDNTHKTDRAFDITASVRVSLPEKNISEILNGRVTTIEGANSLADFYDGGSLSMNIYSSSSDHDKGAIANAILSFIENAKTQAVEFLENI